MAIEAIKGAGMSFQGSASTAAVRTESAPKVESASNVSTSNMLERDTTAISTKETNADGTPDYDWRVFYTNGANVFLIADDYVLNSKIQTEALQLSTNGIYSVYWENPSVLGLTMNTNSKFLSLKEETFSFTSTFDNNNKNYHIASALLDTTKWTNFVNSTYALKAFGGPTVEVWMSSWNKLYPSEKLYWSIDNNHYYIGTEPEPTGTSLYVDDLYLKFLSSATQIFRAMKV